MSLWDGDVTGSYWRRAGGAVVHATSSCVQFPQLHARRRQPYRRQDTVRRTHSQSVLFIVSLIACTQCIDAKYRYRFCVESNLKLCKNGWTDEDAFCSVDWCGPKQLCRWDPYPPEWDTFEEITSRFSSKRCRPACRLAGCFRRDFHGWCGPLSN